MLQLARQPGTTLQALQQAHAQLQAKYDSAPGAAGPGKTRRWHQFNAQIFNPLLQDVHDRSQKANEQQLDKMQQQFSQVTQQAQQVGLQLLQAMLRCKGLLLWKKLMAHPCAAGAGQGADTGGAAQQPVPAAREALPALLLLCLPALIGQALLQEQEKAAARQQVEQRLREEHRSALSQVQSQLQQTQQVAADAKREADTLKAQLESSNRQVFCLHEHLACEPACAPASTCMPARS